MVFHCSLSDGKSLQVFRTLLSILADLNDAIVWMVSTSALISKSSIPLINLLVTVPSAPIIIGITVTFIFQSLFSSLAKSTHLTLFSLSFSFTLWSAGTLKSTIWQVLFFYWLSLGLVVWPRLSDQFVSQNPREFCASRTDSGLCINHLFMWPNLNFLNNSQWITLPTQSCLLLYFLCANLLYLLVVDRFVSITTLSISAILLRLFYSCFGILSPYGVVLCWYQKRFSFSLKISFSSPCQSFLVWNFACLSLKISIQFIIIIIYSLRVFHIS